MSLAYDEYLAEHIGNVNKGLHWMLDNLPLTQEEKNAIETAMVEFRHDESKYDTAEYDPYDKYFYGGNRSYAVCVTFDYAWLHHIHNNPHHWQYWVLLEDDPETGVPFKALQIPLAYIFEMIADWWTFSWKSGNLFEIFDWYADHRHKQFIHPKSRRMLEDILKKIWNVLVMQEAVAGHDVSEIEAQYMRVWAEEEPKVELVEFKPNSTDAWKQYPDDDETDKAAVTMYSGDGAHLYKFQDKFEHSDEEEDDDIYGIPEIKKYPMPDKKHVKSAIRFFNYVDPKYEKELAEAILEKAKEFGLVFDKDITVGDDNRFKKYLNKDEDPQ